MESHPFELGVAFFAVVVVLAAIAAGRRQYGGSKHGARSVVAMPYRLRDAVFSPAERSFYGVLSQAVGSHAIIFAKMRLADIVHVPAKTAQWQAAFNRVSAKHVDFLLCDTDTIRPLLAIELDDASHGNSTRHQRDVFVEEVLRVAGLPLLRVTAKRSYSVADLAAQIQQELAMAA